MVAAIAIPTSTISQVVWITAQRHLMRGLLLSIVLISLISEPFVCHWTCWSINSQVTQTQIGAVLTLHPTEQAWVASKVVSSHNLLLAFTCVLKSTSGDPESPSNDTGSLTHHEHQGSIISLNVVSFGSLPEWASWVVVATPPLIESVGLFRPPRI